MTYQDVSDEKLLDYASSTHDQPAVEMMRRLKKAIEANTIAANVSAARMIRLTWVIAFLTTTMAMLAAVQVYQALSGRT